MFLPQLLDAAMEVESACPVTNDPVRLEVGAGEYMSHGDSPPLVSFVLPQREGVAADVVSAFCCHVHFVRDRAAGEQWVSRHSGAFLLTLEEAWRLGRDRNVKRYPRMLNADSSASVAARDPSSAGQAGGQKGR